MKQLLIISFLILTCLSNAVAQIPSTCFEIESILVDACGNPEGENEMVRFKVGPAPLNVSNLNVNWPNNPFLGICQNPATAGKVAQLNSSITACGLILEPVNGVLPAGANVILVTSTNFITAANSFAQLTDTVYLIFQCAGNTGGHFANATGSGSRTLSINFAGGCSDAVTYNCQLLTDVNGNTGVSGSSTDRDGATANFTWNGAASYVNYGCTAPFVPQIVNAGPDINACQGETISLNGIVSGNFSSVHWTGGNGTWINPNTINAQYTVGIGDVGNVPLQLNATNCNGIVTDVMNVVISNLPLVNVSPPGNISICAGDIITLDAGAGGPYTWSTGDVGPSIQVSSPGTYIVSATNSCGTYSDTTVITSGTIPVAAIMANTSSICPGETLALQSAFAINYLWSTGETTQTINITSGGTYYVIISNGCGSDSTGLNIVNMPMPSVTILNGSEVIACEGEAVFLETSGVGSIFWPGWNAGTAHFATVPGIYVAQASNLCGYDSAEINVIFDSLPFVNLATNFSLCSGNSIDIFPVFNGALTWSNGAVSDMQNFSVGGNYFVIASNNCGADTAFFSINEVTVNAGFSVDSIKGAAPLPVNFTNLSTGADTYLWNFGNGDTSTFIHPSYTFYMPGEHLVILTAMSNAGCSDTAGVLITVNPCDHKTYIPNAFTPNFDEVNPLFKVNSACFLNGRVTIYDRWGKEIYSWTDIAQGWNGNDQAGNPYPMGVYVYMFEYNDVNGDPYVYRGQLNLLR